MKIQLFIILLLFGFATNCQSQDNRKIESNENITLKVKITHSLPVGWGYKYKAAILDEKSMNFGDTLFFGTVAGTSFLEFKKGDTIFLTLYNSHEKNKVSYMPSINGAVSKTNEIWYISNIKSVNNQPEKFIFVGYALMLNGVAMFIWDFADSEAFYVDGITVWDEKYNEKKLTIEAVLIQDENGSVLKDWKILKIE